MKRLLARLRSLSRRSILEREMQEEIESHFALHVDENMRAGMSREEAVRSAKLKFGDLNTIREDCREVTGFAPIESFLRDLQYAVRGLLHAPGFSAVAVGILALGIGINVIVFTVTDAVLYKGFPLVKENDRLVYLDNSCCVSYPDFEDWRNQAQSFEAMVPVHGLAMSFQDRTGFPESFQVSEVDPRTFQVVGQQPLLGRDFLPTDAEPGARRVAILRYSFWERRYNKDPSVIGKDVRVNGRPTTIIGVMPQGFSFPQFADLWIPLIPTDEARQNRGDRSLWFILGKLRPGVIVESARTEMETIGRRLGAAYPETNQGRFLIPQVKLFHEFFIGDNATDIYQAMLAAVLFVLLIACANLANLMLGRGMHRSHEIWIRMALGAGRWRIARQLVIESLCLAGLGGFLGWWIAWVGVKWFSVWATGPSLSDTIGGDWFNNVVDFTMDYRIFVYLVCISLITGVVFGLVPAFRLSKFEAGAGAKEGARGSTEGVQGKKLSNTLVVVELALALVLLTGAGIMVRSFLNIYQANQGYTPERVATALVNLPGTRYKDSASQLAFFDKLVRQIEAAPGVASVSIGTESPVVGATPRPYELEGSNLVSEQDRPVVSSSIVGPAYFQTLGVDILSGREFKPTDREEREPVAIINQRLAREAWPNENPLGKRLRFVSGGSSGHSHHVKAWRTVVGVVPDLAFQDRTRQETVPMVYLPYLQQPSASAWLVVQTKGPPASLTHTIREELHAIDADLPTTFGPFPLDDYLAETYLYRATMGFLFLVFAAIALLLASVGIYAVIAQSVGQRTQEIGIRMALGGTQREIRGMILRQGLVPIGVGVAIGLAGSVAMGQLLRAQLVGVSPMDPLTFLVTSIVLIAGAVLGCLIPARRAAEIDPMAALRQE